MGDIRLGPFRLHQRLAKGGMGEVWAGTHALRGVPVAVKLIRADLQDPDSERHFEREVWAQARLDHPAVLYLFEHGRLDEVAAAGVDMRPGTPWLAMEMCSSTLADLAPRLDWDGLRHIVIPLLEALAHAHSRGVLHRDIKMANVLIATANDLRPGLKLADFGIAHALADEDEETRAAGTPRYMAPEQVTGDWEQLGPWTDLYALGVLTWRLVQARRPWGDLHGQKLLMAMLHRDLDWGTPRFPVPPALASWVRRLTQKSPSKRYQLAADALADFMALPVHCVEGFWLPNVTKLNGTLIPEDLSIDLARRSSFVSPTEDPPIASETSIRMNAAGLGLLSMRQPEFMGRRIERRVLWDILTEVVKRSRPHAISLLGPPRVGRGRLQKWFSEAAECAGQATSVWIDCVPGRPLEQQVRRALRAWFRVGALEPDQAEEHLQSWLGTADLVPPLVRMLTTSDPTPNWERLCAQVFTALGRVRPLIVQLRGASGQTDVQALVDAALAEPMSAVVVVIDAPIRGAEVVELGPLDDASMTRLVDALVGLDPAVRANLVRRASGSPGFLMHTLKHWASEGMLKPEPTGFTLSGDPNGIPPALAVVAQSQLRALEEQFDDEVLASLTLAAVIGQTVPISVWEATDGAARAPQRRKLLAELSRRSLVQEEVARFRFASVSFRQAVLERAGPELAGLHRRCAEVLAHGLEPLELGRHLMAAGQIFEALVPLRQGLYIRIQQEGGRAAMADCALLEEAVGRLEGPARIRWSAVLREVQAGIHLDLGDLESAEQASREVLRVGEVLSDSELVARCWAHIGAVAGHRGRLASRKDAYRHALDLGVGVHPELRAEWWTSLATANLGLGDAEGWRQCMLEAARCVRHDDTGRSAYRIGLAASVEAQHAGDFEGALTALSQAYSAAAESGVMVGRLSVLRARAHTLVHAGRLVEATRAFMAALELAVLSRPSRAPAVLANAVALYFQLGQEAQASDVFLRHRYLLPPGHDGARRQLAAHCAGLAVASVHRDWRVASYHLDRLHRHGTWQWAELGCNLVLCEVALRSAQEAGRRRFAETVAKTALAASIRGGDPTLRERIREAAGLPTE